MPILFLLFVVAPLAICEPTEPPCDTENNDNSTCSTTEEFETTTSQLETSSIYEDDVGNTSAITASTEATLKQNVTSQPTLKNVTDVNMTSNGTTTTPEPPMPTPNYPDRDIEPTPCSCDLLVNECDIGCCCDSDCSAEDKSVFSHCKDVRPTFPPDPRLCKRTSWLYKDNTVSSEHEFNDGLMCIYTDNVKQRHWLENIKVALTEKEFLKLKLRSHSIAWPLSNSVSTPEFESGFFYKSGGIIWTLKNNETIEPFRMITNVLSSACEAFEEVLYLEERKSKCSLVISPTCNTTRGTIRAADFYQGLFIMANPQDPLINQTDPWLPVYPYICPLTSLHSFSPKNCSELGKNTFPEPSLSELKSECENSVVKVVYSFVHNGSEGIAQINVFIWLDSIPSYGFISQRTEVRFEWIRSTSPPQRRSGRPGYIFGLPVILGVMTEGGGNIAPLKPNETDSWLSVAGRDCNSTARRTILFGEESISTCTLVLSHMNFSHSSCVDLPKTLSELMVSNSTNSNLAVATFGDSDWQTPSDWLPVLHINYPGVGRWSGVNTDVSGISDEKIANDTGDGRGQCGGVALSLNIEILWAAVGSRSSPQNKVVGVKFVYGPQVSFPSSKESNSSLEVVLETSVSFSEVTSPYNAYFAPPPKYEVRLPKDFFYPLLKSKAPRFYVDLHALFFFVFLHCFLFVFVKLYFFALFVCLFASVKLYFCTFCS